MSRTCKSFKSMSLFCYFICFLFEKLSLFFVSINKELLASTCETFSACVIVLNNLCRVLGCSIITDFISIMIGFSKVLGCWVILFDCFSEFVFFFSYNWLIVCFSITEIPYHRYKILLIGDSGSGKTNVTGLNKTSVSSY